MAGTVAGSSLGAQANKFISCVVAVVLGIVSMSIVHKVRFGNNVVRKHMSCNHFATPLFD